jgi:hypothetical protein
MARYQIRTPADTFISDVIKLMAARAKEALTASDAFLVEPTADQWDDFAESLWECMESHVKAYKLCGVSNVCSEHIKSTSWSNEHHALDAAPDDMIYQLFPRKELNAFLEDLVSNAAESLKPVMKANANEDIDSTLQIVFRCVLGDFLYFNPICGQTELCSCSVQAPASPWWRRRKEQTAR